jgi:mannose-6-phosphate isomerase-like protein (cupin superfamily)
VRHLTVEALWLFVSGEGAVRRKLGEAESVVAVGPGAWLTIPLGARL